MNALGGIGNSSYQLYTRQHELALEAEVSTVSDAEAENGAANSDSVRFAAKEQNKEEQAVPLSAYLRRVAHLGKTANKDTGKKEEAKDSCPIALARSQSSIGENVPLNWLVADQMGGQTGTPQREDFTSAKPEICFQDPAALFVPEPFHETTSGGTLLSQEWLFTPCC